MNNEPNVSVAILSGKAVEFVLYGEFSTEPINKTLNGKISAVFENGLIKLSNTEEEFSPTNEIVFSPTDEKSDTFLLKNVTIGLKFHWEQKQNQRFTGKLKIIIENNNLTIINIVPVEQYLISVISSEMSPTSSIDLLKAHSIISRSWLLAQMEKRK